MATSALGNTQTSGSTDPTVARRARDRAQEDLQGLNRRLFGARVEVDDDGEETWTQEHRCGSCGVPLGERVAIGRGTSRDGTQRGLFRGVETCGSANVCLRCASKIRAEKAEHSGLVLRAHREAGGHAVLVTLTFSHSIDDQADEVIDDALKAWSGFNSGRFKTIKNRWGIVDFIRVIETTHSWVNGLHPHHHVALLTDRPIGQDPDDPHELLDFQADLYQAWSAALETLGREAHYEIGVDVEPVRDEEGVGSYISKIELELTRGDLKRGRGESRSMWQVGLDAADGCQRSAAVWADYVRAIRARRWISTSEGLWERFGINDRTDDEIAEDTGDEFEEVALIDSDVYRAALKADGPVLTEVRHLVEANAPVVVLALVLSRRLKRQVEIDFRAEDDGVPTLRWSDKVGAMAGSRSSTDSGGKEVLE